MFSLSSPNSAATFDGVLQQGGTIADAFTGLPGRYRVAGTGLIGLIGAIGVAVTMSGEWVARKF